MPRPKNTIESFQAKLDKSGGADSCWLWTGSTNRKYYGTYLIDRYLWNPHRLAYTLAHGPIPDGLLVRHLCGDRRCCNPKHLAVGTHKQNAADRTAHGNTAMGEKHYNAKLTDDTVREIRRLYGKGGRHGGMRQSDLAARFGITQSHVSKIVRGLPHGGWAQVK